jgi:hypothetical protein
LSGGVISGIGHPIYVTERGNRSTPLNHYSDRAYENPVANRKELTQIFEKVKETARMRAITIPTNADVGAQNAIEDVLKADTTASLDRLLSQKQNYLGVKTDSYKEVVQNNASARWKIDATSDEDDNHMQSIDSWFGKLDSEIRQSYSVP